MSLKQYDEQLQYEKEQLKINLNKLYNNYVDNVKDLVDAYITKANNFHKHQISVIECNDVASMNKTNDYVYTISGVNKSFSHLYIHSYMYVHQLFS